MLFRPDVQYLYDNPAFISVAETPWASQYLGMKGATLQELDENIAELFYGAGGYQSLRVTTEGCFEIQPSFAGTSFSEIDELTYMYWGDGPDQKLRLYPLSAVGESWIASASITATVDSIKTEDFLDLTDDVKYISLRRTDNNELLFDALRISRNYGLLTGTYFYDLKDGRPITLAGITYVGFNDFDWINFPGDFHGINCPRLETISPQSSQLHLKKTVPLTTPGGTPAGKRIYERAHALGAFVCDPVLGGIEMTTPYRANELSYTVQEDGTHTDSLMVNNITGRFEYTTMDHLWLSQQPGAFVDGKTAFVNDFNCYGTGRSYSPVINPAVDCPATVDFAAETGVYQYMLGGPYMTDQADQTTTAIVYDDRNNDCGTPLDIILPFPLSTSNFRNDPRITLAPNPASSRVQLNVPTDLGQVSVTVFSANGRLIRQLPAVPGARELNVASLPNGVYVIMVVSETGPVGRRRLVVSH